MIDQSPRRDVVTMAADIDFTVDDVHDVAVRGSRVFASEDILDRVRRSRAAVERALTRGRKVYGWEMSFRFPSPRIDR